MKRCVLLFTVVTVLSSPSARAGMVVTIVPSSSGPYDIADPASLVLAVDIVVRLDEPAEQSARVYSMQFAINESDPVLATNPMLTHSNAYNGDIYFWDFSSIPNCRDDPETCDQNYAFDDSFENDERVMIVALLTEPQFLRIPQGGSRRVGLIEVTLPAIPGDYILDLMNADDPDSMAGARATLFLGETRRYFANDGTMTGGRHVFTVVPDPATWSLLFLGTAFLTRKTRSTQRKVIS